MTRSLLLSALAAITLVGCPKTAPIVADAGLATVHIHTTGSDGFDTNTVFIDTGSEVIVVDAQFTPALAQSTLDAIAEVTDSPVRYVIATHPNPDKFNGAPIFQAAGATFITSEATAAAMPGVHAYKQAYFEGAGAFEPGAYPALASVDTTFSGSLTLDLAGAGSVELLELFNAGVSSTQTVVRVNGEDLIVGDLVATDTHAWLEGGIVDGSAVPDLDAWDAALSELSALGAGQVYPGRGLPMPVADAVDAQQEYLHALDDIVTTYVSGLDATSLAAESDGHWEALTDLAVDAFPQYAHSYMVTYSVYALAFQRVD